MMRKLTRRLPPISARHLLRENEIDNQIRLASAEMLLTTSPRLAIMRTRRRGHRSRDEAGCLGDLRK